MPTSVANEVDLIILSSVWNQCEPLFPRIINRNISEFAVTELCLNHSCTFFISLIRLKNMFCKFMPKIKD